MKKWGGLIPFRDGGQWGFCNCRNEIKIIPFCDSLIGFRQNLIIAKKGKHQGLIDKYGNIVIPFGEFNYIAISLLGVIKKIKIDDDYYDEEESSTSLVVNGKEIDFDVENTIYELRKNNSFFKNYSVAFNIGKIINKGKFEFAYLLSKDNYRYGTFDLVNESGEFLDPILLGNERKEVLGKIFAFFSPWNYFPSINGKFGLIDFDGNILVPFLYKGTKRLNEYFYSIELDKKHALINQNGEIITPFIYDSIQKTVDGDFLTNIDGEQYLLETEEDRIINSEIQNTYFEFKILKEINLPYSPFFLRHIDNSYAFPYLFSDIKFISNKNFCIVQLQGHYGLIDAKGAFVLSAQYPKLDYIKDEILLFLNANGDWGIINFQGEIIKIFDLSDVKSYLDSSNYPNKHFYLEYDQGLLGCYIQPYLEECLLGYMSLSGEKYWSNLQEFKYSMEDEEYEEWERLNGEYDDYYDDYSSSSNPWDDVFGPGDESDTAYWNTRDE